MANDERPAIEQAGFFRKMVKGAAAAVLVVVGAVVASWAWGLGSGGDSTKDES